MSQWLIIATGIAYAYVAIEQGLKGNLGLCISYACYAGANVGMYLLAK